jgi:S-adenosylmethionine synthetase
VSHVGKIYNVLAHRIAKRLYEDVAGLREVFVLLLSRIGTPIDQPVVATAQVLLEGGRRMREIAAPAKAVFERELSQLDRFCRDLSRGKYPVC